MMKRVFFIFFVAFFFNLLLGGSNLALAQEKIEINFFSSQTCPHCAEERVFLEDLEQRYPEVSVKEYDVIFYPENKKILEEFYERHQVPERDRGWVPVVFTPTEYFIGFSEQIGQGIEACIEECMGQGSEFEQKIKIPFLGEVNISNFSLPVLTIIFGAMDGFNPCALWVLFFLIVLLINTKSRKKMWLIGGTFILTSGIVYFLILSAWFNLFLAISYVNTTRILIGVFAIGVGLWQIKNFFTYHPGVCRVLGLGSRWGAKLEEKAKDLVSAPIMVSTFLGIIVLALAVNLVEFFCSAGLPAIYTKILAMQGLSTVSYYLYLLLYAVVFMIDDFIIFSVAVVTLSRFGFTEKYNYWTTLLGGLLILLLGLILLFKPELLMFS